MTLDLLLRDVTNPRSFAFQLTALGRHLAELPHSQDNHLIQGKFFEMEAALAGRGPSGPGRKGRDRTSIRL